MYRRHLLWLLPVISTLCLIPFFEAIDLTFAGFFYDTATETFPNTIFLKLIYQLAIFPTLFLCIWAGVVFCGSFLAPQYRRYRAVAVSLLLVLILGSGIIINGVLKEHWGRPRPKQTELFGGKHTYRPVYKPDFSYKAEPRRSFPSGHSSMGFFFFIACLLSRRYGRKKRFILSLSAVIILGGLLSYARIAQGGHYFSDVVVSALVMWLTALFVENLVYVQAYKIPYIRRIIHD
jgi:lipid A 4'-phosphatase